MNEKKFRAAVVSLGSQSSLMVIEAMKNYFEEVDNIQIKNIEVRLGKDGGIFYEGKPLKEYDCIYLKSSFRYAPILRSMATLLHNKTPYMPLAPSTFTTVHNKLLTHIILEQQGIPMPRTYLSSTVEAAKALLTKVNYPIVMKFPEGTQGKGVMFADSLSSASSMLDALVALRQPFIIQEYVDTGGTDIRALVVNGRVVAAMKRKAQQDEKRSNIHAGGAGERIELDRISRKLAVDAAKVLDADICGVDILESPFGPVVIEANISPGLQGLSSISEIDVADTIARSLFEKTRQSIKQDYEVKKEETMKNLLGEEEKAEGEIISNLNFRGERILLPELITKMTKFDEDKDYSIKAKKGKLVIEDI